MLVNSLSCLNSLFLPRDDARVWLSSI